MQDGDIIYVIGEREQALRLAADYSLDIPSKAVSDGHAEHESLDFYDIGIAEIVLLPTSRLVNRLLKESSFRSKYGINIIGIRRKGEYIMEGLPDVRLHGATCFWFREHGPT